jgi:hypothetical protein
MSGYVGVPDWQDPTAPQGGNDRLINEEDIGSGLSSFNVNIPATDAIYEALWVELVLGNASVVVAQLTSGFAGPWPALTQYVPANISTQWYIPYSGPVGDTPTVGFTFETATTTTDNAVTIYGIRRTPGPLRWDSVYPAIGKLSAGWTAANGTTTVLGAPTGGQQYLIKSIEPATGLPQATAMGFRLQCTVQNVTTNLAALILYTGGIFTNVIDCGDGILCDPNTAITQTGSGAPTTVYPGSILYDETQII